MVLPKINDDQALQNEGGVQNDQLYTNKCLPELHPNNHHWVGKWTDDCPAASAKGDYCGPDLVDQHKKVVYIWFYLYV